MKLINASIGFAGLALWLGCSQGPVAPVQLGSGAASGTTGGSGSGSGSTGGSGLPGSGVSSAGAVTSGTSGAASGVSVTGGTGASGAATGSGSGASSGGTAGDNSVLERGKRPSRDGNYVQPTFTTMAATKTMPDAAFNMKATFKGAMFSSPLYLEQGPGGKGIFIASSTTNDVTAFDDTGTQVWTRNVGTPGSAFSVGCGGVRPIGIMGTPVIDPQPGADGLATIYVSAAIAGAAGTVDHYELHALSAKDGSERTGWPAKIDKTVVAKNDGLNLPFDPGRHAQRPALSLVSGVVYVGFGGPQGDCGTYRGWVMAVDTKNPATVGAWTTRLGGGAIWSPGGFASDGNGVIVTTGNYYAGAPPYSAPAMYGDSEGIIRITGMPNAPTRSDAYYPARWRMLDIDDQDLASSSVMLLQVPGATPSTYGVTGSKDGHLYFVNSAMLGTMGGGGEIIDLPLSTLNHSARISAVAYTTTSGIHIAITIDRGVMGCPAMNVKLPNGAAQPPADPAMAALMGLTVTPGAPIKVTPAWCTTVGGPTMNDALTIKNRSASPLVTTTDGKSSPIVWVGGSTSQMGAGLTANELYGVDGETGAILYSGGNCVGIRQWTTPIAVKGHIVLGGDGHLCSWSPQ
jgi:hypothetical protein